MWTFRQLLEQLVYDLGHTGIVEYIAVISGIVSVWYSRKENILVYPTGLLNTTFYVYLSLKGSLFGEASVNFYYTVMSIYGWIIWARRNANNEHIVHIRYSDKRWWTWQLSFFAACYLIIFFVLTNLKREFAPGAIPWADAFASATAFTGMWLMTKKKVESWYWWIATNIASIPLYFVKHYALTSVYYFILLIMAVFGLVEWRRKVREARANA